MCKGFLQIDASLIKHIPCVNRKLFGPILLILDKYTTVFELQRGAIFCGMRRSINFCRKWHQALKFFKHGDSHA